MPAPPAPAVASVGAPERPAAGRAFDSARLMTGEWDDDPFADDAQIDASLEDARESLERELEAARREAERERAAKGGGATTAAPRPETGNPKA